MTNINKWATPKDIQKPVETVYEIKNEYDVPSFEEFMKTYASNGSLNYDDLESSDIGSSKGYGPTTYGYVTYYYRDSVVANRNFCLDVECRNWVDGGGYEKRLNSASDALRHAHHLEDGLYFNVSNEVERKCAVLIREVVRHHDRGNRIMAHIWVKGKFWGGYEWRVNYD